VVRECLSVGAAASRQYRSAPQAREPQVPVVATRVRQTLDHGTPSRCFTTTPCDTHSLRIWEYRIPGDGSYVSCLRMLACHGSRPWPDAQFRPPGRADHAAAAVAALICHCVGMDDDMKPERAITLIAWQQAGTSGGQRRVAPSQIRSLPTGDSR
jgi:hypothetical protein